MKNLKMAGQDFKAVILENKYYVDKTEYIKEIIDYGSDIILVTRPRRFGKTLNMSMLKYFFDINGKEYDKDLFNGLKIMECRRRIFKRNAFLSCSIYIIC